MPFGLMNAPSTFQRLVSRVLVECETFTAAYIDDILVFSHNEQQYQQHLREVLRCLACHNLRVKLKKCSFYQSEIPFLGHVLSEGSMRVEPEKNGSSTTMEAPFDHGKADSPVSGPGVLLPHVCPRVCFHRGATVAHDAKGRESGMVGRSPGGRREGDLGPPTGSYPSDVGP